MAGKVELSTQAQKQIGQLDAKITRRILAFLRDRVALRKDPRSVGESLKGFSTGRFLEVSRGRLPDYR
jgi:mRNA interferase RelE/StbE